MKIKKEYIILVLIIIGLSVYLFVRKTDRTLYELPVLHEISKKDISKIEIDKDGQPVILSKKDNQWYIEPQGYPADENKVNGMLDVLEKLTLTALISESKNYARYDLNQGKSIRVKAWQADTLMRDVEVGKSAASFRHTFIRLAGDDRVFHARDNFRNKFEQTVDNLRDKTVLFFKPSDIQEILITEGQKSLQFIRAQIPADKAAAKEDHTESSTAPPAKTRWQSADGKTVDETGLKRLLSILSNLRCDKFIDDRKKDDFTNPLYRIQLKGGQEYRLAIFAKLKEDDTNYPATSSGSDYAFFLSESQADQLIKGPEEMLKEPEMDEKKSEPATPESEQQNQ